MRLESSQFPTSQTCFENPKTRSDVFGAKRAWSIPRNESLSLSGLFARFSLTSMVSWSKLGDFLRRFSRRFYELYIRETKYIYMFIILYIKGKHEETSLHLSRSIFCYLIVRRNCTIPRIFCMYVQSIERFLSTKSNRFADNRRWQKNLSFSFSGSTKNLSALEFRPLILSEKTESSCL